MPRISPARQDGDQRFGYVEPPDPALTGGAEATGRFEDCGSVEDALQRVFVPFGRPQDHGAIVTNYR